MDITGFEQVAMRLGVRAFYGPSTTFTNKAVSVFFLETYKVIIFFWKKDIEDLNSDKEAVVLFYSHGIKISKV